MIERGSRSPRGGVAAVVCSTSIVRRLEWVTQAIKAHDQPCHSEPGGDCTERPIEYKH